MQIAVLVNYFIEERPDLECYSELYPVGARTDMCWNGKFLLEYGSPELKPNDLVVLKKTRERPCWYNRRRSRLNNKMRNCWLWRVVVEEETDDRPAI